MKAFILSTAYMLELRSALSHVNSKDELYSKIVNAPFQMKSKGRPVGLSIIVLLLVNPRDKTVDRIALADTDSAKGAMEYSIKKFNEIKIPLKNNRNAIVKAIRSGSAETVTDWDYLFTPELTAEESRFNQAGAGIATSIVYPLERIADGGALIFSFVLDADNITKHDHAFMQSYAKMVSKQLSN